MHTITFTILENHIRKIILFLVYLFAIFGIFINTTGVSYAALSEKQKSLYNSGILYYEYDYGQCSVASGTASNANLYMSGDSYSQGLMGDGVNINKAFDDSGYTDVAINAVQGRSITGVGNDPARSQSGVQAINADQETVKAAGTIIIELGTNPENYDDTIPLLMNDVNALNTNARKFWVNVNHYQNGNADDIKAANKAIDKYAERFGYTVIDWKKESEGKRDWFEASGLHPNTTGYKALRDLIIKSVGDVASSTSGGISGDISNMSNEELTWRFLIGKGLTPNQTAGWMANIKAESGFDPKAGEHGSNGNVDPRLLGVGFGLVQWTNPADPPSPEGRRYQVITKANSKEVLFSMMYQLNYMWEEMTTKYEDVYEELLKSKTAQKAHDIIIIKYEAPAYEYRVERINNAAPIMNEYLAKYAGIAGIGTADANCTKTGLSLPSGTGWDLDGPNAMVYYRQDDPKWDNEEYGNCISSTGASTIGNAGCGITSMAMIVSTLTGEKVDPPAMAQIAIDNGFRVNDGGSCNGTEPGIAPYIARKYNLEMDTIEEDDLDAVEAILRKGGLVYASFGVGTFTSQGHLMVIRKVSDDGKSFYIADPLSEGGKTNGESNTKAYTRAELINEGNLSYMYGFYK